MNCSVPITDIGRPPVVAKTATQRDALCITERIVEDRNQLLELRVKPTGFGIELRIAVDKTAILGRVNERRRSTPGRTGCGLCGLVPLYSRNARSGTPASKAVPVRIFRSGTA